MFQFKTYYDGALIFLLSFIIILLYLQFYSTQFPVSLCNKILLAPFLSVEIITFEDFHSVSSLTANPIFSELLLCLTERREGNGRRVFLDMRNKERAEFHWWPLKQK